MDRHDRMTVTQVSQRSGYAPSALRFYEERGLISATRTPGGRRQYERAVLRRLAFIRAAGNIGLTLEETRAELARLPENRTPTKADWARISDHWRARLDEQMRALQRLRDGLDSCIGCGCLSLKHCGIANPGDIAGVRDEQAGAAYLPPVLRR
ncbi:redox-sensitive transcriptional activator SoxR [Nocardioides maradonensis]